MTLVSEKDDSFDNYNSLYYKWDSETNTLLVFVDGFGQFLREERGNIVLSDLMPYDLGSLGDYDALENNMGDVEMRSFDDYFDDDEDEEEMEEKMSGFGFGRRRRRRRRGVFSRIGGAIKDAATNYVGHKKKTFNKSKKEDKRAIAELSLDAAGLAAPGVKTGLAIAAAKQAI